MNRLTENGQNRYILLVGLSYDPVLQHFAAYLKAQDRRGAVWVFLDQEELGHGIRFLADGVHFVDMKRIVPHEAIIAVYNRSVGPDTHPNGQDADQMADWRLLQYYLDWRYPAVFSRPRHGMSNTCKPIQLAEAEILGWTIPTSVILSNLGCRHPQQSSWVCKSISSYRTVVHPYDDRHFGRHLREPLLLQRTVYGHNWRVHVIGYHHLHADVISSDDVDYRYAKDTNMHAARLPLDIEQRCRETARHFKLRFCGIDLIANEDDFFFLEANPNPGYSYFEEQTGSWEISRLLFDALQHPRGETL